MRWPVTVAVLLLALCGATRLSDGHHNGPSYENGNVIGAYAAKGEGTSKPGRMSTMGDSSYLLVTMNGVDVTNNMTDLYVGSARKGDNIALRFRITTTARTFWLERCYTPPNSYFTMNNKSPARTWITSVDHATAIVYFKPTFTTNSRVSVTFSCDTDDPNRPQIQFLISGHVMSPELLVRHVLPDQPNYFVSVGNNGNVDLGTLEADQEALVTLSIYNSGNLDMIIRDFDFSGPSGWSVVEYPKAVVPPSGNIYEMPEEEWLTVVVSYKAVLGGETTAKLSFLVNDITYPSFTCTFTASGNFARAVVLHAGSQVTDSLSFGTSAAGTQYSETITISNLGLSAMTISDVSLTAGSAFTVSEQPSLRLLEPGQSTEFVVDFVSVETPLTAGLSFTTNVPRAETVALSIAHWGNAPDVEVRYSVNVIHPSGTLRYPMPTDDEGQDIGHARAYPVSLRNTGTVDAQIYSATLEGPGTTDLSVVSFTPQLRAGSFGEIRLQYLPTAPTATAQLSLRTNAPRVEVYNVTVSFSATGPWFIVRDGNGNTVSPNGIVSFSGAVGQTQNHTFTITSMGTSRSLFLTDAQRTAASRVQIENVDLMSSVEVDNPGNFTVTQPSRLVLPDGASTTFVITSNLTDLGPVATQVSFKTNVAVHNPFNFTLNAVSVAPGGSADDPHFLGFLGQRFDFTGIPGNVFSWYSDVDVQINGLLSQNKDDKKIYMTQLGVRFGPSIKVILSLEPNYDFRVFPLDKDGQTLGDCGRWWWTQDSSRLVLQYHGYTVIAERRQPANSAIQHINLAMSPYVRTSASFVHGLLGQTHRPSNPVPGGLQGEGVLEGAIEDYLVHDGVLGAKWTFNRFNGTRGAYTRAQCSALLKSPRVVPQELMLSGISGGTPLP